MTKSFHIPMPTSRELGYRETGKFSVSSFALGMAYAKELSEKFRVGAQIKYTNQDLGNSGYIADSNYTHIASTMAYDFGTIYQPKFTYLESFAFGMYIRYFSPDIKFQRYKFELPLTFQLGVSAELFDIIGESKENMDVNLAIDAIHPRDSRNKIHLGTEVNYLNQFFIRAGDKFNYDIESFSVGLGMKYSNYRIDYSFSTAKYFSASNRFSIGINF